MRLVERATTHTVSTARAARMLHWKPSYAMQQMKRYQLEHMRWGKTLRWVSREVEMLAESLRRDALRPAGTRLWG